MRLSLPLLILTVSVALPTFGQGPASDLPPIKSVTMVRKLNPVYPLDELLKGKTGTAEVRFMVDYSGRPTMTTIASATSPVFGRALLAEIESNEFLPPRVNGQPQLALTGERYVFNGEASLEPNERRVLGELRKSGSGIAATSELDKPLTPIRRDPPVFPSALQSESVSGRAEIEFIVDMDGRVVLPRIANASHEDFGWSAATAISRWRFQPPLKGGQKVDVRTTVVINYDGAKGVATF